MKLFSKIAYHSTRQKGLTQFDDTTSEDKAYKGEGAMVHGWGLYLQGDKELNIERYKSRYDETINNELNEYGYSLNALVVDGKEYNRNGYGNKNPWDITVKTSNGKWEDIPSSDFCDTLNDIMDDCWSFDITDASELKNGYPDFFKEHEVEVIADKLDPEENVIHNGSQYTVEIPDDMNFMDERATLNFNDPIIDKIITENSIVTSKDMQPYREELKETIYERYPNVQYLDNIIDEYIVSGNYDSSVEFYNRNTPSDIDGTSSYDMDLAFDFISQTIYNSKFYNHSRHSTESNIELYRELARKFGGEDKASEYLADNGIDGIRYDGGTDGECWVIFNCDKLKIIKEE